MAVAQTQHANNQTGKRRLTIGANVLLATIAVIGIVGFCQWFAFSEPYRVDMTSTGINSLSDGTETLLENLDKNVRITSLYFEADLEEEDQSRYRQATQNLLDLYELNNRTKIRANWINPLKDQQKFQALVARLRTIPKFESEIKAYQDRIKTYQDDLDEKIRAALQNELALVAKVTTGGIDDIPNASPLAQVEVTLRQLETQLQARREKIDGLVALAMPEYAAALNEIKTIYTQVGDLFKQIGKFGQDVIAQGVSLPPQQVDYLQGANGRLVSIVGDIEGETTKTQELKPLSINKLLDQMLPNSNAILVDTDDDATIIDFTKVWPPIDPSAARAPFERRAFKGEEKLTSAILRATHKEQTAIVFVRFGGMPLLFLGGMPGQAPAPYSVMNQQLEDANFVVKEWDLKTQEKPPVINPVPTRTIFVVMRPETQRSPFQQQQSEPFSDAHREKLVKLIGDSGRAMFIAGWSPLFQALPASYEYGDYLKDTWGIDVNYHALLIQAANRAPGEYVIPQGFFNIGGLSVGDHPIVDSPRARQLVFPFCAPLEFSKQAPDGVEQTTLVTAPARDGLWGISRFEKYREQYQARDYVVKEQNDLEGPFTLAIAATKGDAKVVVISSRDFATDQVAFAREMAMTPNGVTIRSRNPGNIGLFINTLHWLNDNTEFMNVGQPIDSAVLAIPSETTVKTVQAITIGAWPALTMFLGGVVWWIRRR
jgi:ABC-type uncharacterized transport system